jgi:hypothetical protein
MCYSSQCAIELFGGNMGYVNIGAQIVLLFCLIFSSFKTLEGRGSEKSNCRIALDDYRYELGVVLIFRGEAPYLKEWLEYYLMLGVQHFYLYNNYSTDHYLEVLSPYTESGIVELFDWPPYEGKPFTIWPYVQNSSYDDALNRARLDRVKWLAIVDSDEFLVPRKVDTLTELLCKYENDEISIVRIWWIMFGTSNVSKIPEDKLLIETLTRNAGGWKSLWKSIVRPERLSPDLFGNPHSQHSLPQFQNVWLSTEVIQCNHYWSRDEFYLHTYKIPRRVETGLEAESCLKLNERFNQFQEPACEPILRFVPPLRKRMGF